MVSTSNYQNHLVEVFFKWFNPLVHLKHCIDTTGACLAFQNTGCAAHLNSAVLFQGKSASFLGLPGRMFTHFVPVWGISDPPFSRRCHWWSRSAEGPEPVPVDQQCAFSPPGLAFFTGAWGSGNPIESVDRASAPGWWTEAVRLTGSAFALFLPVCDNVPGNWNYM